VHHCEACMLRIPATPCVAPDGHRCLACTRFEMYLTLVAGRLATLRASARALLCRRPVYVVEVSRPEVRVTSPPKAPSVIKRSLSFDRHGGGIKRSLSFDRKKSSWK